MKNVIIGIDGGSVNHILPQVKRGKLNNFQKIFDDGFVSNLSVTEPPVTIPSFPCIFSGMDVKDLGKCELYNLDYGVFSSKYWREKSIFSLEEIKTFCLNIPATYPAWKINGEMVTGFLSPAINENMVYPKSLLAEIKNKWIIDGKNVDEIFRAFEIKKKFFLKKLKEDFDLLIYIIRMPDLITHHPEFLLKNTSKNIKKAYRKIDEFLGILLDNPNIDNLIVLSDHGLKKYPKQFSIKKYLESEKILNYNQTDIIFKLLSFLFKLLIYLNPKFLDIKYFHNKIKDIFKDRIKLKPIKNHIDSRFVQFYSNYGGIFLGAK
ncbi:MAG: alkaline phosphatase family protein, partial [Candidatus Lokiarchaeota archaeon]